MREKEFSTKSTGEIKGKSKMVGKSRSRKLGSFAAMPLNMKSRALGRPNRSNQIAALLDGPADIHFWDERVDRVHLL